MIISATRSTNVISTFFWVILLFGLNLSFSFWELTNGLTTFHNIDWISLTISQIAILGIVILLNFNFRKYKFIGVGDGFPGVVFLVFITALNNSHSYYLELTSLSIITFINFQLISLHNAPREFVKEFQIGVLFGLVFILTPNFAGLILMYFVGLTLVVAFSWRDFIIPLLGIFWVLLLKLAYLYLFDLGISNWIDFNFSSPLLNAQFSVTQLLITLISFFEFLILVKLFGVIEKRGIKERVHYWIWIWTAVLLFLSLLFLQSKFNKELLIILLGLPCSIFSVEFFHLSDLKKIQRRNEFLFFLLLASCILLRIW